MKTLQNICEVEDKQDVYLLGWCWNHRKGKQWQGSLGMGSVNDDETSLEIKVDNKIIDTFCCDGNLNFMTKDDVADFIENNDNFLESADDSEIIKISNFQGKIMIESDGDFDFHSNGEERPDNPVLVFPKGAKFEKLDADELVADIERKSPIIDDAVEKSFTKTVSGKVSTEHCVELLGEVSKEFGIGNKWKRMSKKKIGSNVVRDFEQGTHKAAVIENDGVLTVTSVFDKASGKEIVKSEPSISVSSVSPGESWFVGSGDGRGDVYIYDDFVDFELYVDGKSVESFETDGWIRTSSQSFAESIKSEEDFPYGGFLVLSGGYTVKVYSDGKQQKVVLGSDDMICEQIKYNEEEDGCDFQVRVCATKKGATYGRIKDFDELQEFFKTKSFGTSSSDILHSELVCEVEEKQDVYLLGWLEEKGNLEQCPQGIVGLCRKEIKIDNKKQDDFDCAASFTFATKDTVKSLLEGNVKKEMAEGWEVIKINNFQGKIMLECNYKHNEAFIFPKGTKFQKLVFDELVADIEGKSPSTPPEVAKEGEAVFINGYKLEDPYATREIIAYLEKRRKEGL